MSWQNEFNVLFVNAGVLKQRTRPEAIRAFFQRILDAEGAKQYSLGKTEGFLQGYAEAKEHVQDTATGSRN